MMLQDKKIDKDDILKYCEITIDVVTANSARTVRLF